MKRTFTRAGHWSPNNPEHSLTYRFLAAPQIDFFGAILFVLSLFGGFWRLLVVVGTRNQVIIRGGSVT